MADMASITAGLNAVKLAFNIAKDLKDATKVWRPLKPKNHKVKNHTIPGGYQL